MTRLRSWLGWDPLVFLTLGLAVFALLAVLGWRIGNEDDPLRERFYRGPTATDDARAADIAGVVRDTENNVITVQDPSGPIAVRVPDSAVIQVLHPIGPDGVAVGDWVIVGGTDDNVNNFILTAVIVLDPSEVQP